MKLKTPAGEVEFRALTLRDFDLIERLGRRQGTGEAIAEIIERSSSGKLKAKDVMDWPIGAVIEVFARIMELSGISPAEVERLTSFRAE